MEGFPATAASQFHKELRFFFSLLKRKKEAKKEKSSPTLVLYGNASHEDYTRNCHNRFSSTKLPRRGEQAAAAAVTLPFSQLKLGRKVSGDPPHAVTLPFLHLKLGRKVSGNLPLSLLKRKKEAKKEKRKEFALHLYYAAMHHPKITHQQKSPGGANRRLVRRNITLFTLEIGA